MSVLLIWLVAAVAPLTMTSTVEIRVDKKQGADEWFCLLQAQTRATITPDGDVDRVVITIETITARMAALSTMPEPFRAQIERESPGQQAAVDSVKGKTLTFLVDRKTHQLKNDTARAALPEFAGIDLSYWLARAWFSGAPRIVPTSWKREWQLNGTTAGKASPYLAESGTLSGELTIGQGKQQTELRLKAMRTPRR